MKKSTLNKVEEENNEETETMKPLGLENGAKLSPLHIAAIMGNKTNMVALLKEHKDDIDKGDKIGRTPLIFSILGDRYDCAEALIKAGADVNKADVDERTALHWAAYQGNHRFVKLLLDKGAKQGCQDKEGRTPLHLSLSHDNIKVMAKLLKDADVDCKDGNGMTPLHFSVAYERVEHTKMLLHAKASPDCQDNDKKTVLHWTKTNKEMTIVQRLLDYERVMLMLNTKDSDGRTALHLAVAADNKRLVRFLTSLDDCSLSELDHMHRTPLHWAAILGHTSIVEILLDRGSDPLIPDKNGVRPLHYAAQNNFGKTVNAMLEHENVKDVPDDDKRTALMWAAAKGAYDALSVLISHKQDILAADRAGATALHMAAEGGHLQCVMLLLQHQAGVNVLDKQQYTPLFCACQMGHKEVVESLLLHGAAVDLEDKEGRTPLHWAAVGGRTDICGMLLDHGLNPAKKDKLGRPALHYAAYGGFYTCMSLLLEFRADVDARDNTGVTALHWACASGSLDAVKLLFRYNAFPNFVELEGDKLTPLDYAIFREHMDVAQFMIEHSAFTIAGIQDEAAIVIQAAWRGYSLRRSFQGQKQLLILHEKRRKQVRNRQSFNENEEFMHSSSNKQQGNLSQNETKNESESAGSFVSTDVYDRKEDDYFPMEPGKGDDYLPMEPEYEEDIESQISEGLSAKYRYHSLDQDIKLKKKLIKNENMQAKPNDGNDVTANSNTNQEREMYSRNKFYSPEISSLHLDKTSQKSNIDHTEEQYSDSFLVQESKILNFINQDNSDDFQNYGNIMDDFEKLPTVIPGPEIKGLENDDEYNANIYKSNRNLTTKRYETVLDKGYPGNDETTVEAVNYNTDKVKKKKEITNSKLKSDRKTKQNVVRNELDKTVSIATTNTDSTDTFLKPWQIYEREQKRAKLVRLKIESAVIIQKAFRNHLLKNQKYFYDNSVTEIEESEEKEGKDKYVFEEIAALVIQLHWRNYLRNKLVKERVKDHKKKEKGDLRMIAAKEKKPKVILNAKQQDSSKRSSNSSHTPKMQNREGSSPQSVLRDKTKYDEVTQENWRTSAVSGKRVDEYPSSIHNKSRPKTTEISTRHERKASPRVSDTQHRLKSGLSRGAHHTSTNQGAASKVYKPQSWSSNLQKFPLRY